MMKFDSDPNSRPGIAILGAVIAIVFAIVTAGTAAIATLATLITWAVMRRRGTSLTRGMSWLVGVGSVGAVLLMGAGVYAARLPAGTYDGFRHVMDSTSKLPPPPPPEWVRRMTPPAAQARSQVADRIVRTPVFTMWVGVMTIVFMAGIVAAITGSLGWLPAAVVIYGMTGAWPPRAPPPRMR